MASNGFRPALLFLSSSGVSTTTSISARKFSHGTRRSMASSGSPLADKASKRLSASKNPSCPIVASANQNLTHQIRTGREKQLFFEVPLSDIAVRARPNRVGFASGGGGGQWIIFHNVPSYFVLGSNKPIDAIMPFEAANRLGLGIKHLKANSETPDVEDVWE